MKFRKALFIIGIILATVIIQLALNNLILKKLELVTFDARSKLALDNGPFSKRFKHLDKNIVIVAIDEYSTKKIADHPELQIGAWPWPRNVWAKTTKFIERGEPKAVLFDLVSNDVNSIPYHDSIFSERLRRYDNTVLATTLNDPKIVVDQLRQKYSAPSQKAKLDAAVQIVNSRFAPAPASLDVQNANKKLDNNITFYSHSPVSDIYSRHNMMAVVNQPSGEDGVIRNFQSLFKLEKDGETYYMPSLPFAGFLKYMGDDGTITIKNNTIHYKGREIPLDNQGTTPISWHATSGHYPHVHISDILLNDGTENELQPEFFKDKIVLIGRTVPGSDVHQASVDPLYEGTESVATAIDNLINDSDVSNPHRRKFVTNLPTHLSYGLTILFCLLIVFIGMTSKNALFTFANSFMLILMYVLASIFTFVNPAIRLWMPLVVPLYYMLITAAVVYAFRLQKETSNKTQIMNMFGKFVSPKVLKNLLKDSQKLELKSTKKHITVMFCDVKDFTTLSEKCNPEKLVLNLNELFNEIVNIIFENNGTVDKFVGDCVMAYWGDPISSETDAYDAVAAAVKIKKRVNELKIANIKDDKIVFDVKIGINTGDALLGLAGSDKIMSYTAMGDAVNTAARLESSCSKLNRDILISKSTYEETKGKVVVLEVGTIEVKGKEAQIDVYEPIGLVEENQEDEVTL